MNGGITLPNQENVYSDDKSKTVYYFFDQDKKPIHKAREDFKNEKKIIVYPYSYNRNKGELKSKRIKEIEFKGWESFAHIPKDFKKTFGYGFKSKRIKSVFTLIYPKFRELRKLTFGIENRTRFTTRQITFKWTDIEGILRKVTKELSIADSDRKTLIANQLSTITTKFVKLDKKLTAGELENYLSGFQAFDKITKDDAESLAKVFEKLPAGKIITTNHFIKTKEKLDIVYLEDVSANSKSFLR